MKKLCLTLAMLFTCSFGLSACGNGKNGNSADNSEKSKTEAKKLVISTWGYNEDKLRENVFGPFEKANNCEIVLEVGNNSDRLNKVKMMKETNVDVIFLAESYSMEGIKEGLFEKIDEANIPNIKNIYEVAKSKDGYGPAYTINKTGIIYDSAAAAKPVESWKDLWREEFNNNVAIPEITATAGPALVSAASNKAGVELKDDYKKAFDELIALKPNVVKTYSKSSELVNMFTQGEVIVGVAQDFAFGRIKDAVPTAEWVNPKEGSYANLNTVNIVKGSKNKELAEKFIDWLLSEEVQKANALDKIDSPINVNVKLTDEEAKGLTYGEDLINSLKTLDWEYINSVKPEWIKIWNEQMSN